MTPKTFISGYVTDDGTDASLLPEVNQKVLLMSDFGSMMSLHRDTKAKIYGQLRGIYDGSYSRPVGTGERRKWEGKIGILAATTPEVYREYQLTTKLGERFIMYGIPEVDKRAMARRAIRQSMKENDPRFVKLKFEVARFLDRLKTPSLPELSESMENGIAALAEYVACGRTALIYGEDGEVNFKREPEAPGRLAQQLSTLAYGLAIVRGERAVSRATFKTIVHVANDTIPITPRHLLHLLLGATSWVDVKTGAADTGYSDRMVNRHFDGLVSVDLAKRLGGPQKHVWVASDYLRALVNDVEEAMQAQWGAVVGRR